MKKLLTLLLCLLMITTLFAACANGAAPNETTKDDAPSAPPASKTDDKPTGEEKPEDDKLVYRIGFTNLADADKWCYLLQERFVQNIKSAEWIADTGVEVEVITADSNYDIETQTANVETLLTQGVDILCIIGVDTDGNSTSVKAANEEGIPVVMIATEATDGDFIFSGNDEYDMGEIQGKYIAEHFPKDSSGVLLYLQGTIGREATELREAGVRDVLKAERSDIEVVSQSGDFKRETGMQVMEDWIVAYGEEGFDGVCAANEEMTHGALQAMKAANIDIASKLIVSLNGDPEGRQAVKDGLIDMTVDQNRDGIADLTSAICVSFYKGEKLKAEYYVEQRGLTMDNIDQYYTEGAE